MESGAQGCEIIVSGKLRGQRAKAMKFIDGLMIHSGDPVNDYVQFAVRHVLLRQGVLGIKVKIMLPHDTKEGKGVRKPLPDHISIVQPKEETPVVHPYSEPKERKVEPVRKKFFSIDFLLFCFCFRLKLPQQVGHPQQLPPQQQPPIQAGVPGNFAY
jgi:ribosomal protein S3